MRVRKTFFQMLHEERAKWRKENYLLTFEVIDKNTINVMYNNGAYLGDFYIEVDGFWVFQPHTKGGCWSGQVLKMLCEKLQELNKDWEEKHQKQYIHSQLEQESSADEYGKSTAS